MGGTQKPGKGQTYFYVSDQGKVEQDQWSEDPIDAGRLQFHNVFTDRSAVTDHLKAIKQLETRQMAGSKS